MTRYFAHWAFLPSGWARDVRFDVTPDGTLAAVEAGSPPDGATLLNGPVVPGMPNAHSHVAQRALAGRTEGAGPDGDSFWSWRQTMYAFVERLDPDAFEAIAAYAFAEMLEAGYTSVAEFHYLHHAPGGARYANPAEMSERAIAAARAAGIGLTLLPTLYRYSDAGEVAPQAHQLRFVHDRDGFVELWTSLAERYAGAEDVRIGAAFHSLRAVSPADIADVVAAIDRAAPRARFDPDEEDDPGADTPLHVHVSEQVRELDAVRATFGTTPIDLLARTVELGPRWSLIHATHATPAELETVAEARAVAVICPTTEANLGDGIFPLAAFRARRGRIAIGSDSNVTLDVGEELRWLEYVQRLHERRRHVFASRRENGALGESLYDGALAGGVQAMDRAVGALEPERRADLVVLAPLDGDDSDPSLDAYVFKSGAWRVRDVICGGKFVVRDGAHVRREALRAPALQAARATRSTIA